jgi:hypothetical protein
MSAGVPVSAPAILLPGFRVLSRGLRFFID